MTLWSAQPRQVQGSAQRSAPLPIVTLFVLAPLLGEIVGAALRFSYFTQPLRVAAIACFYGAGAVLIREVVHRRGLNGWGLLLLAVAFAVLEEGLGLQTIFNPQGMDGETIYGRAAGVNWIWGVTVTVYHVVWSIVIPIVLTHLILPSRRHSAWLSPAMFGGLIGVYTAGFAMFAFISFVRSDFRLSLAQIIAAGAAVALSAWWATRCTEAWTSRSTGWCPRPATFGFLGFGAGLTWLLLYLVAIVGSPLPFAAWTLAALMFAAAVCVTVRRWVVHPRWGGRHALNGSLGAVLALWVFGLLLVVGGARTDDIAFHVVVLAVIVAGYAWLRRTTLRTWDS